jgi:anti-sigma regulatory factor (Ser/Thr protein kinase)
LPSSPAIDGARMLRLQVPNERAALESTRLRLLDFLQADALSARVIYRLELVLEEVLMNRLWHGGAPAGSGHTDLQLQVQPAGLVLRFEDDGPAFDPTQLRHPGLPSSLDSATPGGLGLLLTRKAVSAWCYERVQGRNCLTLELSRS